jgi:hypothetical protein
MTGISSHEYGNLDEIAKWNAGYLGSNQKSCWKKILQPVESINASITDF